MNLVKALVKKAGLTRIKSKWKQDNTKRQVRGKKYIEPVRKGKMNDYSLIRFWLLRRG